MWRRSIYYITVYAFLIISDGGEGSAQADRLFPVLYVNWHADRAVYQE